MDLAPLIDHTLLSPTATAEDIDTLCQQAIEHGFAAVCVLPSRVPRAARRLKGTAVKVCTVVAFPHGGVSTPDKMAQICSAREEGATELDVVVNLGDVKDGNWTEVSNELEMLRAAAGMDCLKIIIETGVLTREEKIRLAQLCTLAHVDFVKTSTGSAHGGATVEDVALLAAHVGPDVRIKASGGISSAQQARELAAAGASRLGTSHGAAILGGPGTPPPTRTY